MASSSSSLPSNLTLLISNLSSFVTVKLDSSNYIIWQRQFQNILRANGLIGYVEGSIQRPPMKITDATGKEVPNDAFHSWSVIDGHLLSCLTATLTPGLYTTVLHLSTCHEVWSFLEKRFTSLSRSHVHQLKNKLNNVSKKSKPMEEYLEQIKDIANQLALVSASVDDDDLILAALNGLPTDYDPLATTIRAQIGTITMDQASSLLCSESIHIESKAKKSSTDLNVAFTATRGGFSSPRHGGFPNNFRGPSSQRGGGNSGLHGNRGGFSSRGGFGFRGGGFRPNFRPQHSVSSTAFAPIVTCQICDKPGHSAKTCWYRMNNTSQSSSTQPRAFVASNAWNFDPWTSAGPWNDGVSGPSTWYLDSAATNHITNDVQNLDSYQSYFGNDQVTVGNGGSLPIRNTGQNYETGSSSRC